MAYDIAPLKSYVRFYLAIVSQLERVWQSLVAIETSIRDELGPFANDLAPVSLSAVATLTDPVRALPNELASLWRPEDDAELEALTDVYEVVGRFSFQGDGDANLARVGSLVDLGQAAAHENDEALQALAPLADLAKQTSARLREAEIERARADRADREAKLDAMVETVLLRAKQTIEALEAVPAPSLEDGATSPEEYKRFRAKLQHVYHTCLPFLKNAIDKVWSFVDAPVPQSFPEDLPLVPELPPELVELSGGGSEDLEKAERTLTALADETAALKRAKEELAAKLVKMDADLAAAAARREEHGADIEFSRALLDWTRTYEQVAQLRGRAGEVEGEVRARILATSKVQSEAAELGSLIETEEKMLAEEGTAVAEATQAFEELKKKEPLLFGKDEWRNKTAEAEAKLGADRAALAAASQAHAQRKMELSAAMVRVQTAEAEQSIAERGLADLRQRGLEAEKALRAIEERLGSRRPSKPVASSEIEEIVSALEERQAAVDREIDRLRTEQRRLKDDGMRTIARERQIEVERQSTQARLESASVARAEGLEAAQKRLAAERKTAVEEHVREVLGALSKSLGQVGTVFVDPARERLRTLTEPDQTLADRVAAAGEAVAPVVVRLMAERGPEIKNVEALLQRIRQEFCEAAPAACRAAWGA